MPDLLIQPGAPELRPPADVGASAAITGAGVIGDSITLFSGEPGGFAPRLVAAMPAGVAGYVRAQNSRVAAFKQTDGQTGEPIYHVDGDGQNSLMSHLSADAAAAQLLFAMIGTNEMVYRTAAQVRADMAFYWAAVKAKGMKLAWCPPPPPSTGDAGGTFDGLKVNRLALTATIRDPAVWGQCCDVFDPSGEHPDLNAADNAACFGADNLHLNQTGQDRIYEARLPVVLTLLDASRASSTQMYASAWPASETDLATAAQIVRRFVVSGLAHRGVALTGGNALSVSGAGAELRRGTSGWATSHGGWLYNGDVVELRLTTSASAGTAASVQLQVAAETRTLSFTTGAAVTPVGYAHGDVVGLATGGATHAYPARAFAASGVAVIAVVAPAAAATVTIGGASATRVVSQSGWYGAHVLEVWTAPVAAGAHDVAVTFAAAQSKSVISWGVATDAAATLYATPVKDASAGSGGDTPGATVPANGLLLAFFDEYAGGAVTPGTVNAPTVLVDEGSVATIGDGMGMMVAKRTAAGSGIAASFNFSYGPAPRVALVFKALGT